MHVVEALQGMAELSLFGAAPGRRDEVGRAQSALIAGQRRMALMRGPSRPASRRSRGPRCSCVLFLGGGLVRTAAWTGPTWR